jgi:hypothetical protein
VEGIAREPWVAPDRAGMTIFRDIASLQPARKVKAVVSDMNGIFDANVHSMRKTLPLLAP